MNPRRGRAKLPLIIYSFVVRFKLWWAKFYTQYGFWGTFLLAVSFIAIYVGLRISYRFYETLQPFLEIAKPGDILDTAATGMIGDFIGGVVGPILSFVGVLLFFLALRLQSQELGLQIKELAETRRVFTTQQFENTFFNLLQTQQEIRMNLEVESHAFSSEVASFYGIRDDSPGKVSKSTAVFELIKEEMFRFHNNTLTLYDSLKKVWAQLDISEIEKKKKEQEIIDELTLYAGVEDYTILSDENNIPKSVYKAVFNEYSNKLGHYFRNLYHILSYLKDNEDYELNQLVESRSSNSKYIIGKLDMKLYGNSKQMRELRLEVRKVRRRYRKYAAFVQAQMSSAELFLLFYNSLFFPKMKELMHHYDFLENLNADDLLDTDRDKQLYKAFTANGVKFNAVTLKSKEELLKI